MPVLRLDELCDGESAEIIGYDDETPPNLRMRFVCMGLTRGVIVERVRRSVLGDPIEFRVRGYFVSLRKSEAHYIKVRKLGGEK